MADLISEQEITRFLRAVRHNPRWAIERFYWIKDKRGRVRPMGKMNPAQLFVHTCWQAMKARKLPIRMEVLKLRQEGLSTYFDARILLDAGFRPGRNAWKISHTKASVSGLFAMTRRGYDHLPEDLQANTRFSNRYELVFAADPKKTGGESGLDSQILTLPAESVEGTRSHTIQMAHCSEVAFWPDGETIFTAMMGAVPEHEDTAVIIETTANGVGNFYYDRYTKLIKRSGLQFLPQDMKSGKALKAALAYIEQMEPGEWLPVFIPWSYSPSCRAEAVPENIRWTDEELSLQRTYGLEPEQLFWRRGKIEHGFNGDKGRFDQEFPLTIEDAFIKSGRPRFNMDALKMCQRAIIRAGIRPSVYALEGKLKECEFDMVPRRPGDKDSVLRVWDPPDPREQYVIGADPANGGGDPAAAQVLRSRDFAVVANLLYCGSIRTFSQYLVWLALWYKRAFLGVEANAEGLYAAMYCVDKYNNCYQRQAPDELEPTISSKEGWKTTATTRPMIIAELDEAVVHGKIFIPCTETLEQMANFVHNEDGKAVAASGYHDDLVLALCIAVQLAKIRPYVPPQEAEYYARLTSRAGQISKITGY